jgi:uncharacterized protein (DUF1330 family)
MSVYFIVNSSMIDSMIYNQYLESCDEIFKKYKGKYLAVDNSFIVVEGTNSHTKIVVIEFDNEHDFNEWYYSNDYQEIVKYRLNGAECNSVLVHGK